MDECAAPHLVIMSFLPRSLFRNPTDKHRIYTSACQLAILRSLSTAMLKGHHMPSFEHNGTSIYYEEFGQSQGFPILTFAPAGL